MGDASAVRDLLRRIDSLPRKANLSPELEHELKLARSSANASIDTR